MENLVIRKLVSSDVDNLLAIAKQTFIETFSDSNDPENMQKYLDENFNTIKFKEQLSNPDSIFYFAMDNNIPVGYLKINFKKAQTEIQDKESAEIERIYVLKQYHGKKVGQVLFDKAVEVAKTHQVIYLWLGVWIENHKAIRFYKKNGFVEFGKHIFRLGKDEQTDIMMKLKL